jgi:hypothetical protein
MALVYGRSYEWFMTSMVNGEEIILRFDHD